MSGRLAVLGLGPGDERYLTPEAAAALADRIWDDANSSNAVYTATTAGAAVEQSIRSFTPTNDSQRLYHSQAVQTINDILQARLALFEQSNVRRPTPFLVVLVFWLFILFASVSLFSPINPMALGAIVVIALSASGAIRSLSSISPTAELSWLAMRCPSTSCARSMVPTLRMNWSAASALGMRQQT